MFDEIELAYLEDQLLARLATVDDSGQPDNSAVGFMFDGKLFWIGGLDLPPTRKYKNVANGHSKVALIVDDYSSLDPWQPRGLRLFGEATIEEFDGMFGPGDYIKVTPTIHWSWCLHEPFELGKESKIRRTVWT
jgi:pyridoxamine 5'-phosphate oxidase family protein